MCRFVNARILNSPDRHQIPHPDDCGAYFIEIKDTKKFVLFVDPKRPEKWKRSDVVTYLSKYISAGFEVQVVDRGYRFDAAPLWNEHLSSDWVKLAQEEGRKMDYPSFVDWKE